MEFLLAEALGKPVWAWLFFIALVIGLLAFDLGVLHRGSKEIGVRQSLRLSAFYIVIGLLFSLWVLHFAGEQAAVDYLTGFVVEKSLAMDNIFVIAMIFTYFGIPRALQHRVLVYGVIGVLLLRGVMIGAGAAIVAEFEWVLLIFAAFLVFTGVKMLTSGEEEYDVAGNPILKFLQRNMRVSHNLHGDRFFVCEPCPRHGRLRRVATPLFLALVMVELADVIFAVDSIPAIFAITTDPYVVYTSNIFAILGLRALFFALSAMMHRFAYMQAALALVLIFIGGKVILAEFLDLEKVPATFSLGVTLAILAGGVLYSLWRTRGDAGTVAAGPEAAAVSRD